jgi:glycosyltransferase involved in cell wall biosynthesis
VLLLPGFVDNQLFSDITNASDVTLLPYRHVTGSGVLLASLTLGTGVVASDLAFFREILEGHEGAGRLAPVEDAAALAAAVEEYLSMPAEDRRRAVTALSERFAWRRVVRPVVEAIRLQAAS